MAVNSVLRVCRGVGRIVILDDVGHEPFIEEPNRTFDELGRFLTTEPPRTTGPR